MAWYGIDLLCTFKWEPRENVLWYGVEQTVRRLACGEVLMEHGDGMCRFESDSHMCYRRLSLVIERLARVDIQRKECGAVGK